MKSIKYLLGTFLLWCMPVLSFAVTNPRAGYVKDLFGDITEILTVLLGLLMALAVVLFVWGVIKFFIAGADDPGNRATGRTYMLYAIIGLVAIVGVWGLVNIVVYMFALDSNGSTIPSGPGIPTI